MQTVYILRVSDVDAALNWFKMKNREFIIIGVDKELKEIYTEVGAWAMTLRWVEKEWWCIDKILFKFR